MDYKPTEASESFDVQFELENLTLTEFERRHLVDDVHGLHAMVERFPFARLHVAIHRHARTKSFHLKTALTLPNGRLFTGERADDMHLAWQRCLHKLASKLKAHEQRLERKAQREHGAAGTRHEPRPSGDVDLAALTAAANEQDYASFRQLLMIYDEALENRIGRWVQRTPHAQAALGKSFTITDVLEEVYLLAMEAFAKRPPDRLGNWLEGLIDKALGLLVSHPSEVENLEYVREMPPPEIS